MNDVCSTCGGTGEIETWSDGLDHVPFVKSLFVPCPHCRNGLSYGKIYTKLITGDADAKKALDAAVSAIENYPNPDRPKRRQKG